MKKDNDLKKEDKKFMEERSESFLKAIAMESESEMLEGLNDIDMIDIPNDLNDSIDELIKKNKKDEVSKRRKMHLKKMSKMIALIVLALVITITGLTVTVDAFRERLFSYFISESDDYKEIRPIEKDNNANDVDGKLKAWNNYYYPEYIPGGYLLADAANEDPYKDLIFRNSDDDTMTITISPVEENLIRIDNTNDNNGEVDINGYEGFWINSDGLMYLVWLTEKSSFEISADNLYLNEIVKVAESLVYVK